MRIVAEYSFNDGVTEVNRRYPHLVDEIKSVVEAVNALSRKTKISKEKTMTGRRLFSPPAINRAIKAELLPKGWMTHRQKCDYAATYYLKGYKAPDDYGGRRPYREMDFVKEKLGVEVQLGKYAFMVYNVAAKMTIFRNLNVIDAGVEIVPVKEFAEQMSTGVSYFEQFVWDLEKRGVADIDVPVMILGILP